jgi:hypothetical protein
MEVALQFDGDVDAPHDVTITVLLNVGYPCGVEFHPTWPYMDNPANAGEIMYCGDMPAVFIPTPISQFVAPDAFTASGYLL